MTWTPPEDAPRSDDLHLLGALSADLEALGYTVDGVAGLLGEAANDALDRDEPVPALLRTRGLMSASVPNALSAAVHLWLLGQSVSTSQLAAALPVTGVDGAAALGLVEESGGQWRSVVDLRPYSADDGTNLWVTSDLGSAHRPGVLRRDHVLGVGQASLNLAQSTIRTDVGRALDLGTGCGIQIFHLLRHAGAVVATDLSARALAFARFNLLLNAAALKINPQRLQDRVDLRQGNLLEPVTGEEFDLVVSNPPFVITPRSAGEDVSAQFTYRDGGLPGDDIVATLLRGVSAVLAPGGVAQMLGNWEIRSAGGTAAGAATNGFSRTWHARIEGWLPIEMDAWVIQREELSPEEYAETWLRDAAENRDPQSYERAYAGYLHDFASRKVHGIGFGLIWLRKPAGPGRLRRFEDITHRIAQPVAPDLAAAVQRSDWLSSRTDEALLLERLIVAEDVTEERHQRPGAEHPGVILLRQGAGLRRTRLLSSELTGFVSVCDGDLAVGQIISALAALLEENDPNFCPGLLAEVRELIGDGFVLPSAV